MNAFPPLSKDLLPASKIAVEVKVIARVANSLSKSTAFASPARIYKLAYFTLIFYLGRCIYKRFDTLVAITMLTRKTALTIKTKKKMRIHLYYLLYTSYTMDYTK
jgi:hypothetical protein